MSAKAGLLLAAMILSSPAAAQAIDPKVQARIDRILKGVPLIDGHNDLVEQLREHYQFKVDGLASGTDQWKDKPLMTDMARLHQGGVGGQFWSVYIPSDVTGDKAIRETIEQIDTVKRLVKAYPKDLALALSADDVVRIHKTGRIASLIGIEGGHQIGGSLAALRQFYDLGARYMTLTHFKNNEFADSATDDPKFHGISDFGRDVIHEMNRLGMLVDLSHVSTDDDARRARASAGRRSSSRTAMPARSPTIRATCPTMSSKTLRCERRRRHGQFLRGPPVRALSPSGRQIRVPKRPRLADLDVGQPDLRTAGLQKWQQAHPQPKADVGLIADHIDHIAKIAGHDHVGLGGDLDGIDRDGAPAGMNSVAGYPLLFAELIRRGWSDADLARLAGGNLLRVLRQAEAVSLGMKDEPPAMARLQPLSPTDPWK